MRWNWVRVGVLGLSLVACSKQGPTTDQPVSANRVAAPLPLPTAEPTGWFDPRPLLVRSNGTHRLGGEERENTTRDPGSKLVYFDEKRGNNATAEVYWWDGHRI